MAMSIPGTTGQLSASFAPKLEPTHEALTAQPMNSSCARPPPGLASRVLRALQMQRRRWLGPAHVHPPGGDELVKGTSRILKTADYNMTIPHQPGVAKANLLGFAEIANACGLCPKCPASQHDILDQEGNGNMRKEQNGGLAAHPSKGTENSTGISCRRLPAICFAIWQVVQEVALSLQHQV